MGTKGRRYPADGEDILYKGRRVRLVRHLGAGRAADVDLVKTDDGVLSAEKRFTRGGALARLLYKMSFQAPLPYHTNYDAVATAYHMRKLLRELTAVWYGSPKVADSLYVRQDKKTGEWILGTEFVKGRGPDPNPRDSKYEIGDLCDYMDDLSGKLEEAGLLGVIWQTDKSLSVPTSNFMKDAGGNWILVDAEPGMPGIIFFQSKSYLKEARRKGMYPLFGDVDLDKLRAYLLSLKVDKATRKRLRRLYGLLNHHLVKWKRSEMAVFRTAYGGRKNPDEVRTVMSGYHQGFKRRFKTSPGVLGLIRNSWLLTFIFLLVSDSMYTFLTEEGRAHWKERRFMRMEREGRITPGTRDGFLFHTFLSQFLFKELHRWAVDPAVRKEHGEFGFYYLEKMVEEWDGLGRLLPGEKKMLLAEKESGNANIRGFGYHLFLKPLSIIFDSVTIGGVLLLGTWEPILVQFIAPALRAIAVLVVWGQERLKGRRHKIGLALLIGGTPKIGILGFPTQMFHRNRSVFMLIGDNSMSGMGERVPIFGASNSTVEHWFIRGNPFKRKKRIGGANGHNKGVGIQK